MNVVNAEPASAVWTEDQSERLREMAKVGDSASEIGMAVGKSRSAVLGRAMRMKISLQGQRGGNRGCSVAAARSHKNHQYGTKSDRPVFSTGRPKLKIPRSRTFVVGKGPDKAEEKPDKRHTGDAWDPEKAHEGARRVDLMGLERGMCKWPLFSDDEKRIFCGADVEGQSGGGSGDGSEATNGGLNKSYCKTHGKRARGRVAEVRR